MKKLTTLFLSLLLLAALALPAAAAETYTHGTLYYTIADGSVTITGCFGRAAEVTVPASIAGYPVNTIASGAFTNNPYVRTVNLPDTVTSADGAFAEFITVQYGTQPSAPTSPPTSAPSKPKPSAPPMDESSDDDAAFGGESTAPALRFTDVAAGGYYAAAVQWAVENGITSGTGNGKFSPDSNCTRGQIVTFLWRTMGQPKPQGSGTGFADVQADAYYAAAVQWAVENGITSGTGNNHFSPNAVCTRAQIVTFLHRAMGSPIPAASANFADVSGDMYCSSAVSWAVAKQITQGTGNGLFSPDRPCNRAQAVTFLWRALA